MAATTERPVRVEHDAGGTTVTVPPHPRPTAGAVRSAGPVLRLIGVVAAVAGGLASFEATRGVALPLGGMAAFWLLPAGLVTRRVRRALAHEARLRIDAERVSVVAGTPGERMPEPLPRDELADLRAVRMIGRPTLWFFAVGHDGAMRRWLVTDADGSPDGRPWPGAAAAVRAALGIDRDDGGAGRDRAVADGVTVRTGTSLGRAAKILLALGLAFGAFMALLMGGAMLLEVLGIGNATGNDTGIPMWLHPFLLGLMFVPLPLLMLPAVLFFPDRLRVAGGRLRALDGLGRTRLDLDARRIVAVGVTDAAVVPDDGRRGAPVPPRLRLDLDGAAGETWVVPEPAIRVGRATEVDAAARELRAALGLGDVRPPRGTRTSDPRPG